MFRSTTHIIRHLNRSHQQPTINSLSVYYFSSRKRSPPTRGSSKPKAVTIVKPEDAWVEVVHEETKQTYWWNQITNETTHVGAPKPTSLQNVPPPTVAPPPQNSGGIMSGLGGMVVQGMAWGVGTSIAHNAVNSLLGSDSSSSSTSDTSSSGSDDDWF